MQKQLQAEFMIRTEFLYFVTVAVLFFLFLNRNTTSIIERVEKSISVNKIFYMILFCLFIIAVSLPFSLSEPFPHHEGSILYPAFMLNHGYEPLRDVTIQHFPAIAYVYGFAFRLFGEYLYVSRLLTLSVTVLLLIAILRFLVFYLPYWLSALITTYIYFTSGLYWRMLARPWTTTWSLLFIMWGVVFLYLWITHGRNRSLIFSGLLVGFAGIFRMNAGFFTALMFMVFILYADFNKKNNLHDIPGKITISIKHIMLFGIPALLTVLAANLVLYLRYDSFEPLKFLYKFQAATPEVKSFIDGDAITGSLGFSFPGIIGTMLFAFIIFAFFKITADKFVTTRIFIPSALVIALIVILVNSYFLSAGIGLIFAALIINYFMVKRIDDFLLISLLLLLALVLSSYPRSEIYVFVAIPIAAAPIFFNAEIKRIAGYFSKKGNRNRLAVGIFLLFVLIPFSVNLIKKIRLYRTQDVRFKVGFYKYISVDPVTYNEYTSLYSYIEKNNSPEDDILIWRIMSLQYAYLNVRPAVLPYITMDNFLYKTQFGKKIDSDLLTRFQNSPPALVVYDLIGQEKYNASPELSNRRATENSFPLIQKFIENNYMQVWESPNKQYVVYRFKNN